MKKAAVRYAAVDSPAPSPLPAAGGNGCRALVAARSGCDLHGPQPPHHRNLGTVLRRLISMDKKGSSSGGNAKNLPVPTLPAPPANGGKLPGLSRKLLFQKAPESKKKALTEVKNGNTRTLSMVLRSERELLAQSKEQEDEIASLRLLLEQKDMEVERLKDLCLRQREEIRALKDAVLFPDQQPELHLRDEISSLTGQIQCLAQELAQVKVEKHSARICFDEYSGSPRTLVFNQETAYSLECSTGEADTPTYGSPDEMFLKDLNPCLTPCISKSKSEEYDVSFGSKTLKRNEPSRSGNKIRPDISYNSRTRPMSRSSDHHKANLGTHSARRVYKSDQDKIYQNLF